MNSTQLASVEHSTDAPRHVAPTAPDDTVDSVSMLVSSNGIQPDAGLSTITVDRPGHERRSEHHRDEPDDDRQHRDHQKADADKGADPEGREAFRPIGLFVRKS